MTARTDQDRPTADTEAPFPGGGSGPSDAWFRSVVEAANEGVWIIDLDGRTIFANRRMAEIVGTSPESMIGTRPFDYLYEEDFAAAREIMEINFAGRPADFEIRFRRPDGSEVPVLGGSAPLRDEAGKITGSVATFSDLTARKSAEQALERSERNATQTAELLNRLLEAATDAIWMRDPEGRFVVANPAACAVMGGSEKEIIGRSIHSIWGSKVGAHLAAEAKRLFEGRKGQTIEEEMFNAARNSVSTFLSNKVPLYSADGAPLGILGVSRDISDRKRTEDELRASEARLAQQVSELNALYASAPIGLAFFSRDYRYLRINDELAAINGVAAEQHIGRTIREVLSDNAPMIEPIIDQVFATGEPVRDLETSGETPQQPGVQRHWLSGFYPVRGQSGDVEAVGIWVIEISERKAAEEREVLLAREVDHRAKNLLAVVQAIVTLSPAEDAEGLKSSIVGRIQALARAHSLLSDSRWDGVDLGQLIGDELAPFVAGGSLVSLHGPAITLRPPAAQSLALVLHELATNAAKYGALSHPSGRLQVRWSRSGDSIAIEWTETGGPAVAEPEKSGFGSQIIRASVERQLRGKVRRDWRRTGLSCVLQIPAAEAVPQVE